MFDPANFDIARFEASAAEAAKLLRALGNERRLMILCQLTDRERSVSELQPRVGLSDFGFAYRPMMLMRIEQANAAIGQCFNCFKAAALQYIVAFIDVAISRTQARKRAGSGLVDRFDLSAKI